MIETSRLLLRLPEAADAQRLMDIHLDPYVLAQGLVTFTEHGRVTSTAPPRELSVALRNIDRMLQHWNNYGYGRWSVVEKNTGNVIGCVGFFHRTQPDIEISWIIGHSQWGNGFATEAARAAIDWAWRISTIDHIISEIRPDDARSMRVAAKAGQRLEREHIDPLTGERRLIFGVDRPANG